MPVVPFDQAQHLVLEGLGGRELAISGYLVFPVEYCSAFGQAPGQGNFLEGGCEEPVLSDEQDANGKSFAVYIAPETSGRDLILQDVGDANAVAAVVLGHTDDARQWQCLTTSVHSCSQSFVVDRLAWWDSNPVDLIPASLDPAPTWIPGDDPTGGSLLAASPASSGSVGEFDPRLNGMTGAGTEWFTRYAVGDADANGTFATEERVYDDQTRTLLTTLPTVAPDNYLPGGVSVSAALGPQPSNGIEDSNVYISVTASDGSPVTSERHVAAISGAILVAPGNLSLQAYIGDSAGQSVSIANCSTNASIGAGELAEFEAVFSKDSCTLQPTRQLTGSSAP